MDISLTEKARIKNEDYNFMYCLIKVGRSRIKCDTRVIEHGWKWIDKEIQTWIVKCI